jgi:hypothetical protein
MRFVITGRVLMKKLITLALATFLFLTISIQQCIAQSVNQDLSPLIVAQIAYTVSTVEMIEDHVSDNKLFVVLSN